MTRDGALAVWSRETRGVRARFLNCNSPLARYAFSPDGKAVAYCDPTKDEAAASIKFWKVRESLEDGREYEHASWKFAHPNALAFSPDGKTLAVGGSKGWMRVFDVESGNWRFGSKSGTGIIELLAITPDGQTLVSVRNDRSMEFTDLKTNRDTRLPTILSRQSPPNCLAFRPDGKTMVFTLTGWGAPARRIEEEFGSIDWNQRSIDMVPLSHLGLVPPAETDKVEGRVLESGHAVLALAYSPDGHILASAGGDQHGEGEVKLWDARTGELRGDLKGHRRIVTCLAFSPDSRFLVTAGGWSHPGEVKIWDLRSLEKLDTPDPRR